MKEPRLDEPVEVLFQQVAHRGVLEAKKPAGGSPPVIGALFMFGPHTRNLRRVRRGLDPASSVPITGATL